MPELPEVETVRRVLEQKLIGQKINNVDALYKNIIKTDYDEFISSVCGQSFKKINRLGKFLIFELEDYSIVSHLRMEGKYFFRNKDEELNKHDHIVFELDNNLFLYNDVRKFGTMHLFNKGDEYKSLPLSKLGYEPFDDIDYNIIKKRINCNRTIKSLLLDQTILTGLGNIYVDEVIFLLKVHPSTKGCMLLDRLEEIVDYSIKVLNKAINLGGTTIRSYTSSEGVTGLFQNELLVHSKKNEPCPSCCNKIVKIKVAGRGTYICNKCQKLI